MSDQIGVGDRVMLVWGCCSGIRREIGWTGTVSGIIEMRGICAHCHHRIPGPHAAFDECEANSGIPLAWLRKLPPDSERLDQREPSEATA